MIASMREFPMTPAADQLKFASVGPLGRLSAMMCVLVAFGGALAEIMVLWVWLSPAWVETLVVPHLALNGAPVALDGDTRLIGFAISMIPMAALIAMLHQSYELFDAFRLGNVLSAEAPMRLRRIGLGMVALGVLRPLATMLLGLSLTWSNPPGQRILAVGLSIDDVMIALFGGLVLAVGHAMAEAAAIAEEHRQIV